MVQPIESEERLGSAEVGAPTAPKHTAEGHESCAYYPGFKPTCTHDEMANGAFYSEDYVREIKQAAHQVLGLLDGLGHSRTPTFFEAVEQLRGLTV